MYWIYPVSRAGRSTHPDKCQVPWLTLGKASIEQQSGRQEWGDGAACYFNPPSALQSMTWSTCQMNVCGIMGKWVSLALSVSIMNVHRPSIAVCIWMSYCIWAYIIFSSFLLLFCVYKLKNRSRCSCYRECIHPWVPIHTFCLLRS